jgi:hypothetical protein
VAFFFGAYVFVVGLVLMNIVVAVSWSWSLLLLLSSM